MGLLTLFKHKHRWEEDGSPYKHKCGCGAGQYLAMNLFPAVGEPLYEWVDLPVVVPSSFPLLAGRKEPR